MSEIKERLRSFITENYLFGDNNGFKDDVSFLEEGIIDSTGVLELVAFIEETFFITVKDEELVPENLDSIINIEKYLQRKMRYDPIFSKKIYHTPVRLQGNRL